MLILRENPVEQFRFRIQSFNKKQRKKSWDCWTDWIISFYDHSPGVDLYAYYALRQTWQVTMWPQSTSVNRKCSCKHVCVLAMCQYETALMIIALYDKICRIWRGRQGNSRGIIKKNLYLIIMVLSSIWPQVSTRNFLLVFWAFVFRYTRNNKIFIKRALLHDRGR